MSRNNIIILIVIVALIGIGAYFLYNKWKKNKELPNDKYGDPTPSQGKSKGKNDYPKSRNIPQKKSNLINKRNTNKGILKITNGVPELTSVSVAPGESFGIFDPKAKNATIRKKVGGIEYLLLRLVSSPYFSIDPNDDAVTFYVPVQNVKAVPIKNASDDIAMETILEVIAKDIYNKLSGYTTKNEYKKINQKINALNDTQLRKLIKIYKENYGEELLTDLKSEYHFGALDVSINRIKTISNK